jgi:hypothetical protein
MDTVTSLVAGFAGLQLIFVDQQIKATPLLACLIKRVSEPHRSSKKKRKRTSLYVKKDSVGVFRERGESNIELGLTEQENAIGQVFLSN